MSKAVQHLFSELERRVKSLFQAEYPPREWLAGIQEATRYTPDLWHLERFQKQLLFVYGPEMLRHDKNEVLLKDDDPLCTAFTFENFSMWKHKLGAETYPVVMEKHLSCEDLHWFKALYDSPWAKIKGELYAVTPERFLTLDTYYENGVKFVRKRTHLIIPYRDSRYPGFPQYTDVKAWMYVGVPEYWDDRIDMGLRSAVPRFAKVRSFVNEKSYNKEYFYFTFAEYLERDAPRKAVPPYKGLYKGEQGG